MVLRPRRCQDPRSGIDKAGSISLPGFWMAVRAIFKGLLVLALYSYFTIYFDLDLGLGLYT